MNARIPLCCAAAFVRLFTHLRRRCLHDPGSAEVADNFTDEVVRIRASAQTSAPPPATWNSDLTSLPAVQAAARQAYDMAGVLPSDIDFAEVHDCFTPAEIIATEDLASFSRDRGQLPLPNSRPPGIAICRSTCRGDSRPRAIPSGPPGWPNCRKYGTSCEAPPANDRSLHKDLRLGLTHNVGGTGGTCVIHILEHV